MKILLVQSLTEFGEPPIFPLGLCYIASHVSQHELSIFDMNIAREPYVDLNNRIMEINPEVIGLSLRNIKVAKPGIHHHSYESHAETIRIIKRACPGAVFVVGGPAFSLYAEQIMEKYPEIDLGVFGEAEESFPELLQDLDNPQNVKGIYYRKDKALIFTGYRDFLVSSKLVSPNRDLADVGKYAETPYAVGVQARRGCVLKCIHCSDRFLMGGKIRLRDPVEVVDEIELLVKDYGLQTFFFVDQIFNIPRDHAYKICREIIQRNIEVKWTAWFNEHYIDEELLRIVKQAGCAYLSFSPDSASNRVLKRIN
ncbi:MAG: cobalamin-dependent protein, partial [Proteobacteria bacterium]|nr:cobalamin-dependent protein [Pseudomonadota bacterium]